MNGRRRFLAFGLAVTSGACASTAWAGMPGSDGSERERLYFTDSALTDQRGRTLRFYSDVLKGKTVLINFMFTGCADACPLVTARMKKVQEVLGEDFGALVRFVSLSVDPLNDTPKQLRLFAEKFELPENGWTLLTGAPDPVQTVLHRLGERAQEKEIHTSILIAGNVVARHWRKLRPTMSAERIAASMRELARSDAAASPNS